MQKKEVIKRFAKFIKKHSSLVEDGNTDKIIKCFMKKYYPEEKKGFSEPVGASGGRIVGDLAIFDIESRQEFWELMYDEVMDKKYKKNTRNFTTTITGKKHEGGEAPIFLIPRERGGPSYLKIELEGVDNEDVQYAPISKGYPMQDLSSFTLGPIVGEGLCIVNAAFSKSITVAHIEGDGKVDLKRKNYWKRSKDPKRKIKLISSTEMKIDGTKYNIFEWLKENEKKWLPEWELWRKSIALSSIGDFHWTDNLGETIAYRYKDNYLNFVDWKRECYIKLAYELAPQTDAYKFLDRVWRKKNIALGLVHPKSIKSVAEKPITRELLTCLINSEEEMACMPYVICSILMGIKI